MNTRNPLIFLILILALGFGLYWGNAHIVLFSPAVTRFVALMVLDGHAANIPSSQFSHLGFAGPGVSDESPAPLFLETQGIGPFTMNHTMFSHRGLYFGLATTGQQGTLDSLYCQGCIMPHITLANSAGGFPAASIEVRVSIVDTSFAPLVSYFDNMSGTVKVFSSNSKNVLNGNGNVTGIFNSGGGEHTGCRRPL